MSDQPERRGGLSRRDFVQGRFWRAFRWGRSRSTKKVEGRKSRIPLVMRYPKSSDDLDVGDRRTNSEPSPTESAARRRTIPVFRPPGAIEEDSFLEGCTRCEMCIKACPHDAIVHAPPRLREAVGTPIIEPDHQACMMCHDFPCISACEPGVLSSRIPIAMGTAKITEHLCLAHHGTTCTVCSERCPVPNAIAVADGKPTVSESACTGCGVCRYVCPAPENAILLMPAFARPPAPPSPSQTHE